MDEILRPKALIVPPISSTSKYAMVPEVGTLHFDTSSGKLSVCVSAVVGSAAWEVITSTSE